MLNSFTSRTSLTISALLLSLISFAQLSFAEQIAISGNIAELTYHHLDQNEFELSLRYSIENSGTASAKEVYPTLIIGKWRWTGAPALINPGFKQQWIIKEKLSYRIALCNISNHCFKVGSNGLPVGALPIKVIHSYKDNAQHQFSSPQLFSLNLGNSNPTTRDELSSQPIDLEIEVDGNGQIFNGAINITNKSNDTQRVSYEIFTAQEIGLSIRPATVDLSKGTISKIDFELKNLSGTSGSKYFIFAIAQWQNEEGVLNFAQTRSTIEIRDLDAASTVLAIMSLLSLFIAVIVCFTLRKGSSPYPNRR